MKFVFGTALGVLFGTSVLLAAPMNPDLRKMFELKRERLALEVDPHSVEDATRIDTYVERPETEQIASRADIARATAVSAEDFSQIRVKYLDPNISFDERVDDLISHLSLKEKIEELTNDTPAIPTLKILSFNYWTEALHGAVGEGNSTVFPQSIGLAATWNTDLVHEVAAAISDELRAKYHRAQRRHEDGINRGLSIWAPNINIFRDPRWGRGQETYGEDPYLTSRMAVAFIRGLQGNDPKYLKTISTPKHFAVHSGPDTTRYGFNSIVSLHDLRDTYFPAFEASIKEAHAGSVMCSYNAINGVPACANSFLLNDVLRKEWGFDGYVVSDQFAVTNLWLFHHFAWCWPDASAKALLAGTDLSDGFEFSFLSSALDQQLISESDLNRALHRVLLSRFKLGLFDPPDQVPYAQIPESTIDSEEHRALARRSARESIVLLKNDGVLPLQNDLNRIAVIGPGAHAKSSIIGDYSGKPSKYVLPLQGIQERWPDAEVEYAPWGPFASLAASRSDVVILFLGLDSIDETEGQDRMTIELPVWQQSLWNEMHSTGKPLVVVLFGGGATAFPKLISKANAILQAWYPGEEAGHAIADVLSGDFNPSARLPVTFYRSTQDLPNISDYDMSKRTYRYFRKPVLFPFGYGLSYSQFKYSNVHLSSSTLKPNEPLQLSIHLTNLSENDGAEVTEVFLNGPEENKMAPVQRLIAFQKSNLKSMEQKDLDFSISPNQLSTVLQNGSRVILPGHYSILIGSHLPISAQENTALSTKFEILQMN